MKGSDYMYDSAFAKAQLELEPDLTLEQLKILMKRGLEHNMITINSPENARGFSESLNWLEQFKTIEEVKGALNL